MAVYSQSKLANVIFAKELQRRFDENHLNIKCVSLHPGVVRTELGRHLIKNKFLAFFFTVFYPIYYMLTKDSYYGA